ncbi:hypothetical protein ES703_03578 [subsurface metagenome]|nr:hypothetical protein [bacterium]
MSGDSLEYLVAWPGGKCQVLYLCEAYEFMEDLKKDYPKDYKELRKIIKHLSELGTVRNREKMEHVAGFKGVWEMKSNKTRPSRLYGFTDKMGVRVITHGSERHEGQTMRNAEFKKTQRYKDRWDKEHP